jgi:hypothetical protein
MSRPRWHDALIVLAITLLVGYGAWALWWGDVRAKDADSATQTAPASVAQPGQGPQT